MVLVEDYRLRGSKDSFWKVHKMGYDANKILDGELKWENAYNMEWAHFIPITSMGLTRAGMVRINESIRTYIYCVLGSQVLIRSPVIGQSGLSYEVQKEFLALVEDSINTPKGIPDSISKYQDVVSKSRTRLNHVVAPGLYLMSDNLVMNMPNIPGYNNELIIAKEGSHMGVNDINTKIIGQVLSHNLVKPSPTKRISIDNNIKSKEDTKHTTIPTKQSTTMTQTSKILTSEAGKHGVIYGTESTTNDHEDMKILLIVSGILAGLGFMYFYGH